VAIEGSGAEQKAAQQHCGKAICTVDDCGGSGGEQWNLQYVCKKNEEEKRNEEYDTISSLALVLVQFEHDIYFVRGWYCKTERQKSNFQSQFLRQDLDGLGASFSSIELIVENRRHTTCLLKNRECWIAPGANHNLGAPVGL
jgi:hypothetical protein